MKNALVGVLIVAAFLAGRFLVPAPAPAPKAAAGHSCEDLKQFKPDLEAYQQLRTAEERYRKADEILGKIMTVFLADLGLRMTKPVVANGAPIAAGSDQREAHQPPAPKPIAASPPPEPEPAKGSQVVKNRAWTAHENELRETVSEAEVKDLLKKSEIKDFFSELKNAAPMTQAQINSISGKFAGEIQYFPKKEVWSVDWNLDVSRQGDRVAGASETSIYINGKRVSHSRSTGISKDFLAVPGSQAILVNVYGDNGYLQVYPNDRLDRVFANYYEKKGLDQFTLAGIATLRRAP